MLRFFATALFAVLLAAPAAAETRALSGFEGVAARDLIEVIVLVGPAYSVEVTGADAAHVATRVENRVLRIADSRRGWWSGGNQRVDARVQVTMPALSSIAASRGATVQADDVQADTLSIAASMGGEVRAAGACATLSASASMGGLIRAQDLRCGAAAVSASMGGAVRVHADESFEASASMGGDIAVAGSGAGRRVAASMGGSVRRSD